LFVSKEVRTIRRSEENEGAGYSSYKEEEEDFFEYVQR